MVGAETATSTLFALLADCGPVLNTAVDQQVQVQIESDTRLSEVAERLAAEGYHLVTVVANDERELEDRWYKIYYVFSHPYADLFVTIEYLLEQGSTSYCSIWSPFRAVEPFEREIKDMIGLSPAVPPETTAAAREVPAGSWLHEAFPPDLFPLRRTDTATRIRDRAAADPHARMTTGPTADSAVAMPETESAGMTLPVGPIHAGIIESGQFLFTMSGEVIEDLQLRLGYTHRGIERMFQSYMNLVDGWRLAEQVSGDTSFAHSLAYCRAAEVLTNASIPPASELLRVLFLELERIHNHLADIAGLAEDVGLDQFASEFSVIREEILRLNKRLTGHRYLRGVNRVGGIQLAGSLDLVDVTDVLKTWIGTFEGLARSLIARSGFRDRTLGVGVLTPDEARELGVTGLAARASGIPRDSRVGHPIGAYPETWHIDRAMQPDLGDNREAEAGDVFARSLVRAREVLASRRVIEWLVDQPQLRQADRGALHHEPRILPENNYTSAIGYAESCRGDVVYWLMQDKMNGIYRCKVRDPSVLNWPALRACVLPRTYEGAQQRLETLVADFPLVNKSFSLSYAGNDL
jgi:Ni,Fe-hydrogenase III large subunit/Ni,Fe-hydrogenase III component G